MQRETNVFSGVLETLARRYFDVELPVSSVNLKKAYRRRCLELHPDVGGDEKEFKEMQEAYNSLTSMDVVSDMFGEEEEYASSPCTTDGTPLSTLGLGLGPTENGSDCPECSHRGYTSLIAYNEVICPSCDGDGIYRPKSLCRDCEGSGKFTQARSKRVVDCRKCGGSGTYVHKPRSDQPFNRFRFRYCNKCAGSGRVSGDIKYVKYIVCYRCGGKGELPMWNPVLRKAVFCK